MLRPLIGLFLTVSLLTLLLYIVYSDRESEEFQEVLGDSDHDPELERTRRVVWEGWVGEFSVRIFRGNQLSYDDRSLLLKTATDHDYYLRVDPDNILRRLHRFPVERLIYIHREIKMDGPLSPYQFYTDNQHRARRDLQRWSNEATAETLTRFHHIVWEADGTVRGRLYPGYPVDESMKEECYHFVNLLDQFGCTPKKLPEVEPTDIQPFS